MTAGLNTAETSGKRSRKTFAGVEGAEQVTLEESAEIVRTPERNLSRPLHAREYVRRNHFCWFQTDIPTLTAILSDPKALCLEKNT